jgi:hypothetical protein
VCQKERVCVKMCYLRHVSFSHPASRERERERDIDSIFQNVHRYKSSTSERRKSGKLPTPPPLFFTQVRTIKNIIYPAAATGPGLDGTRMPEIAYARKMRTALFHIRLIWSGGFIIQTCTLRALMFILSARSLSIRISRHRTSCFKCALSC